MEEEFKFPLDEETRKRLYELCGGDEKAMREFAAQAVAKQLSEKEKEKKDPPADLQGLEDYLKSGNPGSRAYGIKGQGW
ncbi:MAG: hypothetical protein HY580_01860 [Nitrospinae bacterium]|nr:hypothetical protein [Nitrospinota bacterium]